LSVKPKHYLRSGTKVGEETCNVVNGQLQNMATKQHLSIDRATTAEGSSGPRKNNENDEKSQEEKKKDL
jgi:hypothetical protein